ncbi:MAG: hypothetical protein ACK56F_06170, partial [bacterium]
FWSCGGGYGTVELAMGGGLFFLFFLQLAVSSFGGLMSAVGILCYVFFVGGFVVFSRGFLFLKVVDFFNNLLQVVSSQSEPRGGSGASA